jgi:hypothetical protein
VFSESDRRNVVLGTLVVVLLIGACVGTIQLYKLNIPEHVDRSTIDVTQSDYNQALQKWLARGVSEYELSIRSGSEEIILRVPGMNSSPVEVIQHLHSGSPADELNLPTGSGRLRRMTVDRLFGEIKRVLDFDTTVGANQLFYDYSARFDPDLGYPTYYSAYQRITKPSREIVWRNTLQPPVEVTNLKIIR